MMKLVSVNFLQFHKIFYALIFLLWATGIHTTPTEEGCTSALVIYERAMRGIEWNTTIREFHLHTLNLLRIRYGAKGRKAFNVYIPQFAYKTDHHHITSFTQNTLFLFYVMNFRIHCAIKWAFTDDEILSVYSTHTWRTITESPRNGHQCESGKKNASRRARVCPTGIFLIHRFIDYILAASELDAV